ncbi:hypothetical protein TVAG_121660 [Trichomonas vaginalis G3]|uniref:LisH domain-containing protein n=1 Tax=Trichomonas vaginalis (strain ATCC PRA-98 / G3) TaxID=412133 RepID=A2E977_TRIV3|nr:WD40 repeat-like family [Trichomonas vaginalis G3]EAY10762.1 hypothetical protein TVAG_121660 [Trichomonas vaginalis G3]KAI5536100.1 WD40 repeat-like family [Trichomonas vaginalis G3]|eukprot:XP_001322985.1 hypothetical protein [Trichomonas vaginalis G3]
MHPVQVVLQFLKEENYMEAFNALEKESGIKYKEGLFKEHMLRQTFGELQITGQTTTLRALMQGKKLKLTETSKKVEFNASPVAIIAIPEGILASFNDKTIRLFDADLNELKSTELNVPTILCFQYLDGKVYYCTMGGHVGVFDIQKFESEFALQVSNNHVTNIRILGDYIVASSYSGELSFVRRSDFILEKRFKHPNAISSMCLVNNGVIYALQNDNSFMYRSLDDIEQVQYLLMNPIEFDTHGFGVRDMKESPSDKSSFIVLTDQNRAVIYKFTPGAQELEVLANVDHVLSDGLTQPQMIWPTGPIFLSTTDDLKVNAVDIADNKLAFQISNWHKATRCLTMQNNILYVGAFDKSLSSFVLEETE